MDFKNKAINLFVNHTQYSKQDITKITSIHNGYTNISFKFTTSDKQSYQIRLSNTKNVDRANEKHILDLVKFPYFIYFNIKTGDAIKKWIDGKHPRSFTKDFLKQLLIEINHIHGIKITKTVLKHDYLDCWKMAKVPKIHKDKYLQLINKYKNLPLMLCHNDLNAENILIDKKQQLVFIDFEWGRLNNKYWDIANFIRETNLSVNKIKYILSCDKTINSQILYDFIYICTNYAYQWTFNMKLSTKILKCRKWNLMKMNKYYKFVSRN